MDAEISKKGFSIIVLLLVIFVGIDTLLYLYVNNNKEISSIKKNDYNSYSSVYITADKQASIYLSNYYNLIRSDINKAFEKYEKRSLTNLKTVDEFREYLSKMNISSSKVTKLRFYNVGSSTYYAIIDANGNHVTFKAKGVMDYIVDFR